ncbi:MAG: PAS domain S-box protein [Pedobacter sp.]|nr:MAG: PAS domain S-box protein [Pedobacter sp.]
MSLEISDSTYEARRLAALYELEILDTSPEEDYDNIVALAGQITDTELGMLVFLDQDRVWYKSKLSLPVADGYHDAVFWAFKEPTKELFVLPDMDKDPRSADHPFVTGPPYIRFAVLVPLVTEEGLILGHLAVGDTKPRELSERTLDGLRMLGNQVMSLLKLRVELIKSKKMESESRMALDQINGIFQSAVDAVIITDESGVICRWNPQAEQLFGWPAEEAIGQLFHEIVVPARNHASFWNLRNAYDGKALGSSADLKFEFIAMKKDKSEFDASLGISPTRIDGQLFFIGFASDISARKQITYELDKQKAFYENILNKIPTDIAVFDTNHRYVFLNPGAIKNEELRKYIIGKDDFEYAAYRNRDDSVAKKRREQFLEATRTGKEIRWQDSTRNADGEVLTTLRRLFPVYDENGKLYLLIGFGIDITDRITMEEKQSALVKQLSAQNTQLLDFCNIVSHNLRGPLINMSMLVEFIEESTDPEEQKLLVSKLSPVIDSLNTTFNELVESIQIKQDLEIQSEKIKLKECMQRTLDGLEMEIARVKAVITVDFDDVTVIRYPPKYLGSIFHNLISNALKYHSPKRQLSIAIKAERINDRIILSVKDNGLGIDLIKHHENVFKIGKVFHKHPNAKGLGLYMTKAQVDAMGGTIWVESMPDEGATFYVVFIDQ